MLLGISIAAGAAMALCGRAMVFPQFPRMSLEELEIMRSEMGIPAHVFQQTHDGVLHGSMEDIEADGKARELIQRVISKR